MTSRRESTHRFLSHSLGSATNIILIGYGAGGAALCRLIEARGEIRGLGIKQALNTSDLRSGHEENQSRRASRDG
jgi:hypothetical protein